MTDMFHRITLLIDNDRGALGVFLAEARERIPRGSWTADAAASLALTAWHEKIRDVGPMGQRTLRDVAVMARQNAASTDWHAVADHYRVKVAEGVTVPAEEGGAS